MRGKLEQREHLLHYREDGALAGPDKEHAETLTPALHLLQSALVAHQHHAGAAGPGRTGLGEEAERRGPRGLTALFWSDGLASELRHEGRHCALLSGEATRL
ncbi:hypothetical protein ACWGII_22930 [Streptomyces sp. NPDC054855]